MTTNLYERICKVDSTNPYFGKDLAKAKRANKFIGRGSLASSTNKYATAAGGLANCGEYSALDTVFISAEGARRCRLKIDTTEINLAVKAKATFITDSAYDRNRAYNVGEREVEKFLLANNYTELTPGCWKPK